jgi:creatinine amidohydrolase
MSTFLPTTVTTDREVAEARVAVLPVGSFEQHGPHLPLVTDTLVAVAIADAIAGQHHVLRLPPLTLSCSHEHAAFPGTVSISAGTLASVVADVTDSLLGHGVNQLVVVNGHGGNYVLANIVQQANLAARSRLGLFPMRDDWQEARSAAGMTTNNHEDMHAGELETSILLAAFPDYLREGWQHDDHACSDRRLLNVLGMAAHTASGVIGMPSFASEAKGQAALHSLAEGVQTLLKALNETSSDR